jgi:F-type H+-transporting ATPase subunit b
MAAETHETHATTEASGETVFPPFDTTHFTSQIFWLVVLFGLLYWLMSRIALPRVGAILDDRATRIANDLAAARTAQEQAAEAQRQHDKTLADAKAAAQATAQETHRALAAEADAKRHALESELATKMAAAETQIAASKASAMSNVNTIATDAAHAIVEHLTGRAPDRAAIEAALAAQKG